MSGLLLVMTQGEQGEVIGIYTIPGIFILHIIQWDKKLFLRLYFSDDLKENCHVECC